MSICDSIHITSFLFYSVEKLDLSYALNKLFHRLLKTGIFICNLQAKTNPNRKTDASNQKAEQYNWCAPSHRYYCISCLI